MNTYKVIIEVDNTEYTEVVESTSEYSALWAAYDILDENGISLNMEFAKVEIHKVHSATIDEKRQTALEIALSDMILRFQEGLSEKEIKDLIDNSTEKELDDYIIGSM